MVEVLLAFLMILIIGTLSLVGVFMLSVKEKLLDNILFVLVAFATGTILASALFDLIPESIHHMEELNAEGAGLDLSMVFYIVMGGFFSFFVMERFLYWFHGHAHQEQDRMVCYTNKTGSIDETVEGTPTVENFAILNLIGDGLHNFLDGIIIVVAFLSGIPNGIVITLAVLFHELPQEVGDFGILVYGGFSRKKALSFNFLSAMIALLGGLLALFLSSAIESFNMFFLAFSGGGFLYLACTELMPELLKQKELKKSIIQSLIFVAGIIMIITLLLILPHE